MARPRIFVSSTYHDLRHIRNSLEAFIDSYGYDSILFESGDIPFAHDTAADISCYKEIDTCHMLVLIIGGRYGSPTSTDQAPKDATELEKRYVFYNSITKKEYETAREKDIPIFLFVEKGVLAEFRTYKENKDRTDIKYAHVDNVSIFKLLDDIFSQRRNNFVKDFERFEDISTWLRDQWAGLFASFLMRQSEEKTIKHLSAQLNDLGQVTNVLKTYSESLMRGVDRSGSEKIIQEMQKKLKKARMERFLERQPLRFLMRYMTGRKNTRRVFNMFIEKESLDEFLSSFQFEEGFLDKRLSKFRQQVERDYVSLRSEWEEMDEEK